jgi:hypothetical protein
MAVRVYDNWRQQFHFDNASAADEYDEIENNDGRPGDAAGLVLLGSGIAELTGGIGPLYYDGDAEDCSPWTLTPE